MRMLTKRHEEKSLHSFLRVEDSLPKRGPFFPNGGQAGSLRYELSRRLF